MPIYEFQCRDCGYEFEKILPFSTQSVPACPQCNSNLVERQVGRPAIHFKGSGWYITDSKAGKNSTNGSDSKSTEKTQPATEGTTAEGATTSDTKSDTKSTAKESQSSTESVA
ncbi:MAG: zinc ribbon domain-containing protein [Caldilineaceae bacterium]